jgi:hypothetical protein
MIVRLMKEQTFTILLAALIASSLAGCAASNLSTTDVLAIKSIAIEATANPTHFGLAVGDVGTAIAEGVAIGPGASAGILAGSLAGSAKAETLTDVLAPQNLRLGDELPEAVGSALKRDGYDIGMLKPMAIATSDAVLDLQFFESTYERHVWGKIGSHLVIATTLRDRISRRKLFYRIYRYDMHMISIPPTLGLTPKDEYGFDEPDQVLTHPDIVAAGFRAAIPMIAADIAQAFKRPI